MNFLIDSAWAQAAAPSKGGGMQLIIMMGLFFLIFYFMLIRPQSKRAKEHKAMLAALATGDEVVTGGGILGKVIEIGDSYVTLEIASGVNVKVQRQTITQVLPKGTLKNA